MLPWGFLLDLFSSIFFSFHVLLINVNWDSDWSSKSLPHHLVCTHDTGHGVCGEPVSVLQPRAWYTMGAHHKHKFRLLTSDSLCLSDKPGREASSLTQTEIAQLPVRMDTTAMTKSTLAVPPQALVCSTDLSSLYYCVHCWLL